MPIFCGSPRGNQGEIKGKLAEKVRRLTLRVISCRFKLNRLAVPGVASRSAIFKE
jgi:hypothetical protein